MYKKGKAYMSGGHIVALVLIILAAFGGLMYFMNKQSATAAKEVTERVAETAADNCPDDGDTSLKITVYNLLNETGSESYDVTMYILGEDGGIVETITDTTTPATTTIDCGYDYTIKAIAADGASGDNSQILSLLAKPTNSDAKVEDGVIKFSADRSNMNLKVGMEQHGTLQFKLYDNEDARYAYDTGDSSNTDWETDGVTFRDGDNATAFSIGSGGFLDLTLKVKGVQTDTDFQDAYVLIAVEAPVDKWNEPSVKWDGKTLEDISDSGLTSYEDKKLSSYEYVYKITDSIEDDIFDLDFYMEACAGCDPTADVEIDFFAAGNYLSTSGVEVKTGAAKDDSSNTVVYTTQDVTIDVS